MAIGEPVTRGLTLLVGVIGVLLLLLLLSLIGFWSGVHPPRYVSDLKPSDLGWPYTAVEFTTADGLRLRGWLVPGRAATAGDRAIILLHGYPFDKGNVLPLGDFLRGDYDLLYFDFRYFGESEGNLTTIGDREVEDLRAAVAFLRSRGYQRIGVWGFSFGAAVALLSLEQGVDVEAMVADSSYADLAQMAEAYYGNLGPLSWVLARFTDLWARIFLGVAPRTVSPADAARDSTTPILLIHSRQDEQIGFRQALQIQAALAENPKARFWFVEVARHGEGWSHHQTEYEARVRAIFVEFRR